MHITLTIEYTKYNQRYDIEVDNKNVIIDVISMVNESFKVNVSSDKLKFIKSKKCDKYVETSQTFMEADVWTGDILQIK